MQNAENIEFRQVRDLGQVINILFSFIRQNIGHLLKNVVFIVGPFVLLAAALWAFLPKDFLYGSQNPTDIVFFGGFIFLFFGLFGIMMTTMLYQYLILYQKHGYKGFDTPEIIKGIQQSFLMVVGTYIGIGVVAFIATMFLVIIVSMLASAAGGFGIFLSVLLVIGAIVFFIYFAVVFSLILMIRFEEGEGLIPAVGRAFFLIKNHWWETFGVIFVAGLIQSSLSYIVIIPLMIYGFTQSMFSETTGLPTEGGGLFMALYYGSTLIVNIITSIIPVLAIAFQYYSLVERKEAKNLVSKIASFGTEKVVEEDPEEDF